MSIRLPKFSKLSLFAAALFLVIGTAQSDARQHGSRHSAQDYQRIQNRWKPKEYLHVEHGDVESGSIKPGWWSAMWAIEEVDGYVRFQNKFRPGEYLNIEHGSLELGPIKPGWWSAMWTLDQAQEGYVRICNRWREGVCIHIEHGEVEAGEVEDGWWSAMWRLSPAE